MSKAIALQVIVLDLADALDAQRLPREILASAPPTLSARHAGHLAARFAGPRSPRVTGPRIAAKRLQLPGEDSTPRHGERCSDTYVMERARTIVESQQQRT